VALAVGDLLHIAGYNATNDVFTVEKADADGKPAQLIAAEINTGSATSLAADIQEVTGLNTNAGNVGDQVYLDAITAGSWTLTAPTGSDQIKQIVGRIKVKSATVGKIVLQYRQDRDRSPGIKQLAGFISPQDQARRGLLEGHDYRWHCSRYGCYSIGYSCR